MNTRRYVSPVVRLMCTDGRTDKHGEIIWSLFLPHWRKRLKIVLESCDDITRNVSDETPLSGCFICLDFENRSGFLHCVSLRCGCCGTWQDRHCTYNVTRWGAFAKPLFQWKTRSFIDPQRVCSLSYLARKAYAPYFIVICGLSGCTIFFHILVNGTIFRKKLLNRECVFLDILCNFYVKHFLF
jgi:hypothetical protein